MPNDAEAVRRQSIERYRRRAADYDTRCDRTWPLRIRAVAALALEPGQVVLDVGCGTGLSFEMLRAGVGETGTVIGLEQSPDMAQRALARVRAAGWPNVDVIVASAQSALLPRPVDALLFNYTHDICRSPAAVRNLLGQARPGARVSLAGIKAFPSWLAPLNLYVYLKNRAYNGNPGELRAPWDLVAAHLVDWRFEPTQFGMGYLAQGRLATPPSLPSPARHGALAPEAA
jgi:SAM-dependent methyltransferase